VLEDILTSATPAMIDGAGILRQFSPHIPPLVGDREQVTKLVHQLLHYAQSFLLTVGRAHRLVVSTHGVGPSSISADAPALFPLPPPTEGEIELLESEVKRSPESP